MHHVEYLRVMIGGEPLPIDPEKPVMTTYTLFLRPNDYPDQDVLRRSFIGTGFTVHEDPPVWIGTDEMEAMRLIPPHFEPVAVTDFDREVGHVGGLWFDFQHTAPSEVVKEALRASPPPEPRRRPGGPL